ncbi:MAG: fibronectin type III domain-containing protein [Candidatus Brocadiia bacterium]
MLNKGFYRRFLGILLVAVIVLGYGGVCQDNVKNILTGSSTPIEIPYGLTATAFSSSQINLSWIDNSENEDGFSVERKTGASGSYHEIATLSANNRLFTDTNVTEIATYYYRITAFNTNFRSDYSNEVSVITPWTIITLASGSAGGNTPIAIDTSGKIHCCYYDISNYRLQYVTNAGGNWATITIDNEVGEYASLALDRNNKVHISYYDRNNVDLKYATNVSGAWQTYTVDADGYVGFYSSIAVDLNNKIHISYYDNTSSDLKYATNISGSWAIARIDSVGNTGMFTSLAIDMNNKAHISYYDQTDGNLKYATNLSGAWVISTVDSSNDVGLYTDMSLDPNNKVHISYYDATNKDLKYATNASGVFVCSTVDSVGDVGKFTGITLDLANEAHISYYDVTAKAVKYARKEAGSWSIVNADSVRAEYTSLVIETNKVYIAYLDVYNHKLNCASNSKGNWQVLQSPRNLITTADSTSQISLSWQDSSGNENGFRIERKSPSDADYIQIGSVFTNTNVYTDRNLIIGTSYSYRVLAWNNGGTSAYSNQSTTTTLYIQSASPILTSPANGSSNNPINISLFWQAANNSTAYQIQISIDSGFTSIISEASGITATSLAYAGNYLTTYYWRVRGVNPGGTGNWSSTGNFTTIIEAPVQVVLSSPIMSATSISLTPELVWAAANRASYYNLQVSSNINFSSFVINQNNITSTVYTTAVLNYNTTYYWRVRASNAGGTGVWSETGSFVTIAALPALPLLATPVSGTLALSINPTLTWDVSNYAASYEIQVSDNISFAAPLTATSTVTSTMLSQALSYSTSYYWRIRGVNVAGLSSWSAIWSFVTNISPPLGPVLSLPSDSAANISVNPTLTWDSSSTATSYQLQVAVDDGFSGLICDQSNIENTFYVPALSNSTVYYWRVRASNAGGTGAWSVIRSFTTIIAVPAMPALSAPSNNSTVNILSPQLVWNTALGAVSYSLQVSTDSGFNSVLISQSGIAGLSYQTNDLTHLTVYYWRVKASNIGGEGVWSDASRFTINVPAPAQPVLVTPQNNAAAILKIPQLSWQVVNTATSYQAQVAADAGFASVIFNQSNITGTNVTVSGLNYYSGYYWKVKAYNVGGGSDWSTVFYFTTLLPPPELVAPSNNPTVALSVNPTLSWNAVSGVASYTLNISSDINFEVSATYVFATSSLSYTVNNLANGTVYYWRVKGVNAGGEGDFSTARSFQTIVAIPALVSPVNYSVNESVPVSLTWNASKGATSYHIQISTAANFSVVVLDQSNIAATSTSCVLSNLTSYYWRVRSVNSAGTSDWSQVFKFDTIIDIPAQPTLNAPANGAVNWLINDTIRWNAANRAVSYRLQVATDAGFSEIVLDQNQITGTTFTPAFNNLTTYYWRVLANNIAGSSSWSNTWSFTTIIAFPAIPIPQSPIQGATGVITNTVLSWYPADRSDDYQIQIATDESFNNIIVNQNSIVVTNYQVANLAVNTTHYWRVKSNNIGGTSSWSEVYQFTTLVIPPPQPTLALPGNSAINVPVNMTMTWNASPGATSYRVQVSETPSFANLVKDQGSITVLSYYASALSASTVYYWRVHAVNSAGASNWSETWSFTTAIAPPGLPTLNSPLNTGTGYPSNQTLSWFDVPTAVTYRVRVSTDIFFSSLMIDQNAVAVTSYVPALSHATTYYWQVKAYNSGGEGDWSLYRSFSTIGIPGPTAPLDAAIIPADNCILTWSQGIYNETYHIQFGKDANFVTTIVDQSGLTTTSYTVTNLMPFNTYYWRVQGINVNGVSAWSPTRSIVTIMSNSGNGSWPYLRQITINNTGSALNDYQVAIAPFSDSAFINEFGLVASYHFSETSGSTAADCSGYNNTGIINYNLIDNSGFESGNWGGSETWDNTQKYTGAYSGKLVASGVSATSNKSSPVVTSYLAGKSFTVSAWVNATVITSTFYLRIQYYDASNSYITHKDWKTITTSTTGWQQFSQAVATSNALHPDNVNGTVYIYVDMAWWNTSDNPSGTAYVDDYKLNAALPARVDGRYGKALSFQGVGEYVEVRNASSLNLTDAISIEAWVDTTNSPANQPIKFIASPPKGTLSNNNRTWSAGSNYSSIVFDRTFDAGEDFEVVSYWAHDYRGFGMVYGSNVSHYDWNGWSNDGSGPYWGSLNTSGFPSGYTGTYFGQYHSPINGQGAQPTGYYFMHKRKGNKLSLRYATSAAGPWLKILADQEIAYGNKVSAGMGEASSYQLTPLSIMMTDGIYKMDAYGISFNGSTFAGQINRTFISTSLSPGWNHIVMTYNKNDSSNQQKLYVNGTLKAQGTLTGSINTNAGNLYIGNNFKGVIDEVKILNRALSESEVGARYSNSFKIKPDYSDVRFTNETMDQELYYWQENDNKYWVKIPSLPNGSTIINMYYGNISGTSASTDNAFVFVYQASTGFTSTQGANNWYYQEWTGGFYQDMNWDPANNRWQGSYVYNLLWSSACHPDTYEPARKWMSPANYGLTITGNVQKSNLGGGDGITASIYNNTNPLWSQAVVFNDNVGYNYVLNTVVSSGDAVYFRVNQNANNSYDSTTFNPVVRLRKTATPAPTAETPSAEGQFNITSNLVAALVSDSRIDLSWHDTSPHELGFKIERSLDGVNYEQINTVGANIDSYSDTPITPTTNYWYRVRSYGFTGDGDYSNASFNRTEKPDGPTNLITTSVTTNLISMQWQDTSLNEDGFKIERTLDGVNYTVLDTLAPNTTSYTDSTVLMATTYAYRVRAYNAIDNSNYSNEIVETTPIIKATGGTITYLGSYKIHTFTSSGILNVTDGGNVEVLVVAGGGGGGADMGGGGGGGGVIYRSAYAITPCAMSVTVGAGGAGSPGPYNGTPVSGFIGQNSVFNSLVAIGGGGGGSGHRTDPTWVGGPALVGGSGGGAAARYMYSGAGQTFGAIGTDEQGTAGGNSPSVNNDYYAGGGGGAGDNSQVNAVNATRAGHGGSGLQFSISGTPYYYGGGGGGAAHSAGPAGNGGLGGGGGGSTWTAPSTAGSGGTGGTANGANGVVSAAGAPGANGGTNTGGGGGGGNHQGTGGAGGSGIVIVRYLYGGDNVTTNLVAQVNSATEIVLTWQDNSPTENGFKIERSPDGSGWAQIDTASANATVYTDTGVSGGNIYYYRVCSYNFLLDHPYSNQFIAQTIAPLAPSNMITTTVTTTDIGLQWTDNSDGEQGFKIERNILPTNTGFALITTLPPNTTAYTNSGLTLGTTYNYRVYAYNGIGISAYSNTVSQTTINFTPVNLTFNNTSTGRNGSIQNLTITQTGVYRIEVWGAQGGNSGGLGARMRGDFVLNNGDVLSIVVGQQGVNGSGSSGGGGGSFVVRSGVPLIIAGGGGGSGSTAGMNAVSANTGTNDRTGNSAGGSGGNGGSTSGSSWNGSGGGGFNSNGVNGGDNCTGGLSWANGLTGGAGGSNYGSAGGYGGGGGGTYACGGGGGYSGGGGAWSVGNTRDGGGGGGSFNNGNNQDNIDGVRTGHGLINIKSPF